MKRRSEIPIDPNVRDQKGHPLRAMTPEMIEERVILNQAVTADALRARVVAYHASTNGGDTA
jgi:hypothetical protein